MRHKHGILRLRPDYRQINEEVEVEGWLFDYTEKPNLPFALAALVPNLFICSLFIAFGAYVFVQLDQMPNRTSRIEPAVESSGFEAEGQKSN